MKDSNRKLTLDEMEDYLNDTIKMLQKRHCQCLDVIHRRNVELEDRRTELEDAQNLVAYWKAKAEQVGKWNDEGQWVSKDEEIIATKNSDLIHLGELARAYRKDSKWANKECRLVEDKNGEVILEETS